MNSTRRFLVLLAISFGSLTGLQAESVIDQLYGARKYELADAYWAAGQKFADLGQADRADEFKARAKQIFPGYVPGQAPAVTTTPVVAPTLPAPEVVLQKNLQGQKLARFQFQKLLRGYLTGSAPTVEAVLGAPLVIQGQTMLSDPRAVEAFLAAHPATVGSPDDLFLLDTLKFADGPSQSVIVSVQANPAAPADLATEFAFWKPTQIYTFARVNDTWKLVNIEGQPQ